MKSHQMELRMEERFSSGLQEMGYQLRDVEWVKEHQDWYLRFFISSPAGIGIDDCERVSRYIEEILDQEENFPPEGSPLEVSSPGLEAPLKKPSHWEEALDRYITVNLYSKVDGKKQYTGWLRELDDEEIVLETGGDRRTFERKKIAGAHLAVEF